VLYSAIIVPDARSVYYRNDSNKSCQTYFSASSLQAREPARFVFSNGNKTANSTEIPQQPHTNPRSECFFSLKVLTAMADQEPFDSSAWRLAKAVRIQAFPHVALANRNRTVRLQPEQWTHLDRGKFRPGADVLFRQHYNAHGACIRVELQLASALIANGKVLLALQQQPGGILRGPVPALPVTNFTLPIAAIGWTQIAMAMTQRLAEEKLPFSVQKALGQRVTIHGCGNKIQFTGPIANHRALFQIFSDENMGKDGFLDWLSGEIGTEVAVSMPDQRRYCQMLVRLFDFKNRKACQLEEFAETSNDGHLALAVRTICGDRPDRESILTMPLLTNHFLTKILMFIESFTLLKRNDPELDSRVRDMRNTLTRQLEKLWNSQGIGTHEFAMRLQSLYDITFRLLRSSTNGPDVPLQWASHSKLSRYPRAVFSDAVFDEVVISTATILCLLFGRRVMPHTINNPADAISDFFCRAVII
jgi:hypothetical protein